MSWEMICAFISLTASMFFLVADMFELVPLSSDLCDRCCLGAGVCAIVLLVLEVVRILIEENRRE